jgi:hypothetical protein
MHYSVIRSFSIANLPNNFGISWNIIDGVLIAWTFLILLLTVAHFVFDSVFSSITYFLLINIKLCSFFLVPLIEFIAVSFLQVGDSSLSI